MAESLATRPVTANWLRDNGVYAAIAVLVLPNLVFTKNLATVANLLLRAIQNVINQIGTLSSHYQAVVSGAFLAVVVAVQAYLAKKGGLRRP